MSSSGGFVGGQLGGNYQTGMFVWGVEADIQVAHINGSSTLNDPCCFPVFGPPLTTGVLTRTQNLDWFGTVRGRLGLAIWDRTLVYGTGGVMFGEEVLNSNLVFPLVGYQAQTSGTHTGWVAGGGIEYAFTDRISAKVEGLYYNMGSETIAASTAVVPSTVSPTPRASPTRARSFASVQTSSSGPERFGSGPETLVQRHGRRPAGALFHLRFARIRYVAVAGLADPIGGWPDPCEILG